MQRAFVRIDDGWRSAVVTQGEIVVSPNYEPVTLEQARRSMHLAGNTLEVRIVFNNFIPYEALVVTNNGPVPTRMHFYEPKPSKVSRLRRLIGRLRPN